MKRLAENTLARCRLLATFSERPENLTRTFLSNPFRDCHRAISEWMSGVGMESTVDAIGNLRGVYSGSKHERRRLLVGSHIDTVPNAGAYDGVLGVMLGLALIESLQGRRLPFDIEVVAFSEEEGIRFGIPLLGSRAFIGTLTEETLQARDELGITLEQAVREFGLDPGRMKECAIDSRDMLGFLEFHIEQGPILDKAGLKVAVVDRIVGQSRWNLKFVGQANHAGTTPMDARQDALAGAAEWIALVEQQARAAEGLVATVGKIEALPGAPNVIAGEVRATLDVRHALDEVRLVAVERLLNSAADVASRRGLQLVRDEQLNQMTVKMDASLVACAERALIAAGEKPFRMTSGAGHDAMILAERLPAVMLFIRSPAGLSHHPDESVEARDVEAAIHTGLHLLNELANSYN